MTTNNFRLMGSADRTGDVELSIPGELDALKRHAANADEGMQRIEDALKENTSITRENADVLLDVRDTMIAFKWLRRFVVWISPLIAACVAGWVWLKDHLKG